MFDTLCSAARLAGVEMISPTAIVIMVVAAVAVVGCIVFAVIGKKKKK